MKKTSFFIVLMLTASVSAYATTDTQQQAINSLGQLNGVALQCKQHAEMQRMKQAMVENLPKQRSLGEHYDKATNQSFLDFARNSKGCPQNSDFKRQVDTAINQLQHAFHAH